MKLFIRVVRVSHLSSVGNAGCSPQKVVNTLITCNLCVVVFAVIVIFYKKVRKDRGGNGVYVCVCVCVLMGLYCHKTLAIQQP